MDAGNITDLHALIIPINGIQFDHWGLGVVELSKKKLYYFDSAPLNCDEKRLSGSVEMEQEFFKVAFKMLEIVYPDFYRNDWTESQFDIKNMMIQTNEQDCGVFT